MKILKKLLIPIIIMFVLLLIVVIWAIFKPSSDNNLNQGSEQVVAVDSFNVQSLSVRNNANGDSIGFSSVVSDEGIQTWSLIGSEDDSSIEVDQEKVLTYVSLLSNFTCQDVITDNPTNLAQYGLDPAVYTITINTFSGETIVIYMGNVLANGSYAYFMVEGDTRVFTVASIKHTYCSKTQIDFVSSQLLNLQYGLINTVEFIRTTDDLDITARCISSSDGAEAQYQFFDPFITDSSSVFGNLIDNIVSLKIASFVELSDEEVVLYGLDNPAYTFVFTMATGEQVIIQFSDVVQDEMYYGRSSTTDHYFRVSNQQVTGFESPVMTLIGEWICYNAASDISEITGSYNGQTWDMTLEVPNAMSDPDAVCELDLRNAMIKTPDRNRTYSAVLFESISCIRIGGVDFDATPDFDESIMTIRIRNNNHITHTYDFVPRGTDSYYVMVDEEYSCFYVYAEELFGYGGTNTYAYGVWPAYELLNQAIVNQLNGTYDINDFVAYYEAQS